AMNMPRISGSVVATAPHRKSPTPCVFRPLTKHGPAEMPTTAMKMFKPTEVVHQMVGEAMRPKVGRTARTDPPKIPATSAPPAVRPGDGEHVPGVQHGVRTRLSHMAVAPHALNEDARVRHERLRLRCAQPVRLSLVVDAIRTEFPAMPSRTRAAELLPAAVLL